MYISKCEACMEECPQAQGRHEAAVGRMYAMRELAKCAPYWDSLFDENEEPKITPARLRDLVEADRDGRCVVLPCHIGDPVFMGTGRSKITGYEEDICDGFYIGRNGVLQVKVQNNKGNHGTYGVIGQTAELTHEAADAALKGEQDG